MGTSLTVHPFASLAGLADRNSCPRVLINIERVGDIGSRRDDVVLLGKCDDVVRKLCEELGWSDELDKLWAETQWADDRETEEEAEEEKEEKKHETTKTEVEKQVEHLTAAIAARLDLQEAGEAEKAVSQESEQGTENIKPEDEGKDKHPIPESDGKDTVSDVTQGPHYKPSPVQESKPGDPAIDNGVKL